MVSKRKIDVIEFDYDILEDKVKESYHIGYLVQLLSKTNNQFVDFDNKDISCLGECEYRFRKGVGYKGEIYRLKFDKIATFKDGRPYTAYFKRFQKEKKFLKISDESIELELKYIYPLVTSPHLKELAFTWDKDKTYIIFPYKYNQKKPVELDILRDETPLLYRYIMENKQSLKHQSKYNNRVQSSDFYGVIRVGIYTFSKRFVVIRDNTRLNPHIIEYLKTDWNEEKMPIFDGHISYISTNPKTSKVISKLEAKYILKILKKSEKTVLKIFNSRSISSRLPINLPLYKG